MPIKTVKLGDFSKEIEGFSRAAIEKQQEAIISGGYRSIPDLVEASPVDTGQYASSWDMTVTEKAMIIGNFAPHAPIIEFGARPFTPPIKPLLEWAKRVLQDPSQPPNYSEEVRTLAYGTQKRIAKYGMRPRHVLTNMLPKIIDNIRKEFERIR